MARLRFGLHTREILQQQILMTFIVQPKNFIIKNHRKINHELKQGKLNSRNIMSKDKKMVTLSN